MMDRMISAGRSEKPQCRPTTSADVADVAQHDGGEAREDVRGGPQTAPLSLPAAPVRTGELGQVDAGQHADGPGDDEDAEHEDQGAQDLVAQAAPRRGQRGPQHAPLPVRPGPGEHADEEPGRRGHDEDERHVGQHPPVMVETRRRRRGGAGGERRRAIRPPRPAHRCDPSGAMMSRATRLTATEMTARTRASSARVATAKPVPSVSAPSSWVRMVAATVVNGW